MLGSLSQACVLQLPKGATVIHAAAWRALPALAWWVQALADYCRCAAAETPLMSTANTSTGNTSAATEAPTTISSQLCADSGMLYTLQCPPNTTITITSVHYGRPSATACPGPGGFCAGADVTALFTQKLQSTCAGIPDCTFHLDDLMLPDICPYIRKVAELTYFCKAGGLSEQYAAHTPASQSTCAVHVSCCCIRSLLCSF